MSNRKFIKNVIPQKVFELRQALVEDFFTYYECDLERLKVIHPAGQEPDYPATPEQMARMLVWCRRTWTGYIDKYGLPGTLKPTLEKMIRKEWETREATLQAIPRHQRARK